VNILFVIAAVLFFLAAVGSSILPNPTAWGLFFVALGLALGGVARIARVVTVG
jgi:hypothetical protein